MSARRASRLSGEALCRARLPVADSNACPSSRLMASDWMTQKLLGMYLDDGIYYTSLAKFREIYRANRDLVCRKLDELAPLGVSYTKPRGGVYVWCRLPDGVDSKRFIRRAYNMGVTLIPGHVFYLSLIHI